MRKLPVGKQLRLTLWNFFITFQCRWLRFLIETIVKAFIIVLLSFIVKEGIEMEPFIEPGEQLVVEDLIIYYTPQGDPYDLMMSDFPSSPRTPGATLNPVDTSDEININWDKHMSESPDNDNFAGVIFDTISDTKLDYVIRLPDNSRLKGEFMRTTEFDKTFWKVYTKRFVALQMGIDTAFIRYTSGETVGQEVPEAIFTKIELSTVHKTILLQTFTSYTGLFIVVTVFGGIMDDKEKGMKEFQSILGIRSIMQWLGRLIESVVKSTVSNAVIAFAMTYVVDFPWVLLWIYLIMYSLKSTSFLFFLSVFFSRTQTALIFVGCLWTFTGNIGKFLLLYAYEISNMAVRLSLAFVFPNVGLALGFYSITHLDKLRQSPDAGMIKSEENTFLGILGLMLGSTAFFLLMTFYLDPMWDPETGFSWKPWPRKRRYRGGTGPPRSSVTDIDYVYRKSKTIMFQDPPIPAHPAVRMRNVEKKYGPKERRTIVLDDVSIDFYTNEVTFILGENGSGKSTLLNLINGKCVPNNGTVYVESMDVRDEYDLSLIRAQIGWCPQENLNMPCMTVKQMLVFAGKLRGLDKADIDMQVNHLLDTLCLRGDADKRPSGHGSMRRMICFAFAVMGRPPILLLDEPAAGVDIEGRRLMWKLIKELRKSRVIIIATNHVDMVEEVADRAVILKGGKIRCWGSPPFLKGAIGGGFRLEVERIATTPGDTVKRAVLHYYPEAERRPSHPDVMVFMVGKTKRKRVSRLIRALRRLGIKRLSVNTVSMEEVFMQLTKTESKLPTLVQKVKTSRLFLTVAEPAANKYENTVEVSCLEKLRALMKKEIIIMKRSWLCYFIGIMVEICYIMAIVMATEWRMWARSIPEKPVSLMQFKGIVLYEKSDIFNLDESYEEVVREGHSQVEDVDDVLEEYKKSTKDSTDLKNFNYKHLIGARLHSNDAADGKQLGTPLYSLVGTFFPEVSINVLNNAILRYLGQRGTTITVDQYPLHKEKFLIVADRMGLSLWGGLMVVVLSLWLSAFGDCALQEKLTESFRLQRLSGAPSALYWASRFFCHIVLHAILTCILLITTVTGGINMFSCPAAAASIVVIWLLYGFSGIPFIYVLTLWFDNAGNIVRCLIAVIYAVNAFYDCLERFPQMQYAYNKGLKYILFILPNCSLKVALTTLFIRIMNDSPCRLEIEDKCPVGYNNVSLKQRECVMPRDYLNATWLNCFYLLWTGVAFLILVIIWDSDYFWFRRVAKQIKKNYMSSMKARTAGHNEPSTIQEDTDVIAERIRAQVVFSRMKSYPKGFTFVLPPPNMMVANNVIFMLDKSMRGKDTMHGGLSMRIPSGCCLGLLGADRSCRSLLVELLAGLVLPERGDIAGIVCRLSENRSRFIHNVSFVGVTDGLIRVLKVSEMIQLICSLKGENIDRFKKKWDSALGLSRLLKQSCGSLSHGRRRLLSIALAMVGEPSVLLLDMPTVIMDPRTRRRVGYAFKLYMHSNRAIVLTTNSLTDAETLCSMMACVHFGQVLCLGTPFYLRDRYRIGYAVVFEMESVEDDLVTLRNAMRSEFQGKSHCAQVDRDKVLFVVKDERMLFEDLVQHLEEVRDQVPGVTGYFIRERSLLHILTEGVSQSRQRKAPPTKETFL